MFFSRTGSQSRSSGGTLTGFVKSIGKESPAYIEGLRQYDIIEKFDGGNFSAFNTKYAKMRQGGKGDTLTFDIDRFGGKKRVGFF